MSASKENPILKGLNASQLEAVTSGEGPLLILAGAGSGKTLVLTRRIAYLLSQGIPPFNVLAVTFTNKAAEEMRERVRSMVDREVWIGTFHSFGLRILRQEAPAMKWKRNFSIYDDHDQLVLIKECLAELKVNDREINPKGIREVISRAKDSLKTPELYARQITDQYEELVAKIYERYEKRLRQLEAFDYGDLIMKTVSLLQSRSDILRSYQERFKFILVDEYQDTNHAQYRLIRLLSGLHRNLTVVGDPDQSIYSWRGADISNILNFEKDYPDAKWIKLEQNYRSFSTILDAANALIRNNQMRRHKDLWSEKGQGDKIILFEARDEREEADYTIHEILNYREEGRRLKDIVVFYRMHAQSRVLEEALRRWDIHYKIVGGVRFYDRKEIKDLMAYLKGISFPSDDLSLKRIINCPPRGVGAKSLELLEAFRDEHQISLYLAISRAKEISSLGPKVLRSLAEFRDLMEGLKLKKADLSVSELLEEIIDRTGMVRLFEQEKSIEAQSRIENIKEFIGSAVEFEENASRESRDEWVENFIESISLQTDIDEWEAEENTLTLMTLHSAKGLEFDIVFMVGLEEEIFPHINSMGGREGELEEERRLCYVGITRARERLHLCYTGQRKLYGYIQHHLPSRFLSEIPLSLIRFVGGGVFERRPLREPLSKDCVIEYDGIDSELRVPREKRRRG